MTTAEILRSRIAGKPGVIGATIILKSGGYFDFVDPDPATIHIGDIAWGLANTCRFGGQCLHFYSVAQHSVLVSELVPKEDAFAALMHDAAEAYTGDMVGPLKQLCPDFKVIEQRVEAAIADRFNLPPVLPDSVKRADLRALRTEQRDITSGRRDSWNGLDAYPPDARRIQPLRPRAARGLFLQRFAQVAP